MRRNALLTLASLVLLGTAPLAIGAKYSGIYYGNWGGPWYGSGTPVDQLDAACKEHDLAYSAADAKYRPLFNAARPLARPMIKADWIAAYVRANMQLRVRVAALPVLRVNADGTDSWGGRNIPASKAFRIAYAAGIESITFLPPPFR